MEEEILRVVEPGAVDAALNAAETVTKRSGEQLRAAELVMFFRSELKKAVQADASAPTCWNRSPYRDGSTHVLFEPMVFLERLAGLMPRPRRHLVTYHGVLAPASPDRALVVPEPGEEEEDAPAFRSCQRRRKAKSVCGVPQQPGHLRRRRYTWARLMLQSFGVEVLVCPACGGKRRLLTFLSDPLTIERVLAHLDLPTELPALAPARAPPGMEMALEF